MSTKARPFEPYEIPLHFTRQAIRDRVRATIDEAYERGRREGRVEAVAAASDPEPVVRDSRIYGNSEAQLAYYGAGAYGKVYGEMRGEGDPPSVDSFVRDARSAEMKRDSRIDRLEYQLDSLEEIVSDNGRAQANETEQNEAILELHRERINALDDKLRSLAAGLRLAVEWENREGVDDGE